MSETPFTEFKSASQTTGGVKNGTMPPLISEQGKKLASASAPRDAKQTNGDKS